MKKYVICFLVLMIANSYCFANQILMGGWQTSQYSTEYGFFSGFSQGGSSLVARHGLVSAPGVISNFRVYEDDAPGTSKNYISTLWHDSGGGFGATDLSCTISNAETYCADDGDTLVVATGDYLAIETNPTGTPTKTNIYPSMLFTPTTADYAIYAGLRGAANYDHIHAYYGDSGNDDNFFVAPNDATLRDLQVEVSVAPGEGDTTTCTVYKNFIATDLACTISDTETTCTDTGTLDITKDDEIVYVFSDTGTPEAANTRAGIIYQPDNEGEWVLAAGENADLGSGTKYNSVWSSDNAWNAAEKNSGMLGLAMTITAINIRLEGAIGAGDSAVFTLRKQTRGGSYGDTALTCTVAGSETNCDDTGSISVAEDDLIVMKAVASLSSGKRYSGSLLAYIAPAVSGNPVSLETVITGNVTLQGVTIQ